MTDTPFDLEAPDLDAEAIMREIRARIRERPRGSQGQRTRF